MFSPVGGDAPAEGVEVGGWALAARSSGPMPAGQTAVPMKAFQAAVRGAVGPESGPAGRSGHPQCSVVRSSRCQVRASLSPVAHQIHRPFVPSAVAVPSATRRWVFTSYRAR
jgi:hypothetical protein